MTDRYKKKCAMEGCNQWTIGKHCKPCSNEYRRNKPRDNFYDTGDTPEKSKLRKQLRAAVMQKVRYEDAPHVR